MSPRQTLESGSSAPVWGRGGDIKVERVCKGAMKAKCGFQQWGGGRDVSSFTVCLQSHNSCYEREVIAVDSLNTAPVGTSFFGGGGEGVSVCLQCEEGLRHHRFTEDSDLHTDVKKHRHHGHLVHRLELLCHGKNGLDVVVTQLLDQMGD